MLVDGRSGAVEDEDEREDPCQDEDGGEEEFDWTPDREEDGTEMLLLLFRGTAT